MISGSLFIWNFVTLASSLVFLSVSWKLENHILAQLQTSKHYHHHMVVHSQQYPSQNMHHSWMRACTIPESTNWSCYIFTKVPWTNWWPLIGNWSYNWQCCPISSTRSLNSSSKSTAELLWRYCWCIFNISSPWRIWKEIRSWHHSGYGKWQNLRKIPGSHSARQNDVEENISMHWLNAT